jgi:hypothetical protein
MSMKIGRSSDETVVYKMSARGTVCFVASAIILELKIKLDVNMSARRASAILLIGSCVLNDNDVTPFSVGPPG